MVRARVSDKSYVGEDGFRYVWVSNDVGHFREAPETQKNLMYFESHSLKVDMMKEINKSSLNDLTRSFCILSVQSTYLEQILNEYYEQAVVLCSKDNPMATMLEPKDEQIKIWSDKKGNIKNFDMLSLGQKHQAMLIIRFVVEEDRQYYKTLLARLDKYVQMRNRIVHDLFSPDATTHTKMANIQNSLKIVEELIDKFDRLSAVFSHYILRNAYRYYNLKKIS